MKQGAGEGSGTDKRGSGEAWERGGWLDFTNKEASALEC